MDFRAEPSFDELAMDLKVRSAGGGFDYFPSPGNWGDALINEGTAAFFDHHALVPTSFMRSELDTLTPGSELAVVGGGGGWCHNWSSTPGFVDRVAARYERVVVLPTTYDRSLRELSLDNVTYYSRDLAVTGDNVRFCHDMAFFRSYSRQVERPRGVPLLAFRRDRERHREAIQPDRNFDLSLLGDSWADTEPLLDILRQYRVVYTDRLHLALSSAMMGLHVYLVNGNYPKNERVYRASMKWRLRKVKFSSWKDIKSDLPRGFEGEPVDP